MNSMLRGLLASPVAALALTAHAQAPQALHIPANAYRSQQPEVLAPVAVADPAQTPLFQRAAFSAAYGRAGQPTIAVLWNREFTDMLQQSSAAQLQVETVRSNAATAQVDRVDAHRSMHGSAQMQGAAVSSSTLTAQTLRSTQAARSGPAERMDLEMRAAFMQTMASAGVRLVDRNVVMRTTAARQGGREHDSQHVETEALTRHARLLMEILNTRDDRSPTGWSMYVSIKRLADGVVLSEGFLDGKVPADAPKPAPRFEADPRGGFREILPPNTTADVARRQAEQTLARLGQALRP
jgi:hypothetical protein